ncbi:MAG: phosphoribosylformylglycinamidine synthase subunit PurQ [Sphingomonadales bacterium]|nr:phosphoribosylformylglycinamidine synthase subunit PurQ [Sphingomonadales bacterium]
MKFGIVVFPGSNCDQDMADALHNDLKQEVRMLWHKDRDLHDFNTQDCIVLPGGFSYGDYLRCGAIARFSPMMQSVIEFANRGGKVFGVCNGFQILCESQLLPGALLRNAQQQFVCSNTHICDPAGRVYTIPVAHGEGRYHGSEALLDQLEANNQILFRYCELDGRITESACPNGSSRNIAGICNASRTVFGMMPHPERACSVALGNTDGRAIIKELLIDAVLQPAG